jgi:diacylglycerol kinase (ATP)
VTHYVVIVNPTAGGGAGARSIPTIARLLRGRGIDYGVVCTAGPWHAAELAREACAAGHDAVVAVGGDGTVNEVLNGIMLARHGAGRTGTALGVLPVGRGNDFGFGVGVPESLPAACQTLAAGYRRTIDVGMVIGGLYPQGRYFGNGVGVGFDAVVGFEALKMRHLGGSTSYLLAALKTVLSYRSLPLVRIEYAGLALTQRSLLISVMNGQRLAGAFMMAPTARPDDGVFGLCLVRQVSLLNRLALIRQFMQGSQAGQSAVTTGQSPTITLTALEGCLPAHCDGETLCTAGQQLTIEMLAGQLDIITQPAAGVR